VKEEVKVREMKNQFNYFAFLSEADISKPIWTSYTEDT
jgi:hypothetical protein